MLTRRARSLSEDRRGAHPTTKCSATKCLSVAKSSSAKLDMQWVKKTSERITDRHEAIHPLETALVADQGHSERTFSSHHERLASLTPIHHLEKTYKNKTEEYGPPRRERIYFGLLRLNPY